MINRIFATIAAVLIGAGPLAASHCAAPQRAIVVKQQYAAQQQIQAYVQQYQYAPYYYQVGADLRLDAIAEKVARKVEQKLIEREAIEEKKEPAGLTVLTKRCAICHADGSKYVVDNDAPAFFDKGRRLKDLNNDDLESMVESAELGNMPKPPAKELTKREFRALEDYLFPDGRPSEQEEPESVIKPKKDKAE